MSDRIVIRGARLHNLKNITVEIPKNELVAVTGLSGSGKSTLVFDTLHSEGQRQYMESLGVSRDTLARPLFDAISGLAPSIAIEQKPVNRSPRSTVGTTTEIYTYLRLLFARAAHRPCPRCGADVPPPYDGAAQGDAWDDDVAGEPGEVAAESDAAAGVTTPCPACGYALPELSMAHFSFNSPLGACPTCTGLGQVSQVRLEALFDLALGTLDGGVLEWNAMIREHYTKSLVNAGDYFGFTFDPHQPIRAYGPVQRDLLFYGSDSPQMRRHFPHKKPPTTTAKGKFEGVITNFLRRYQERADDQEYREKMEKLMVLQVCATCDGQRLRPESLTATVGGVGIVPLSGLTLTDFQAWLEGLEGKVSAETLSLCAPILHALNERVSRLIEVGVGYLSLSRPAPTLSPGESQRLRLASLLGSGLTGVLYVLDEPTVGLHQRDSERLVHALRRLRDLGNSVIVIEHDLSLIAAADYILEIGPGAGEAGGQVVAAGTLADVLAAPASPTADYLAGRQTIPIPTRRALNPAQRLRISGAREHNLRDVTVDIPLGGLIAVTGVSGSGKSSLILDILAPAARQAFGETTDPPGAHDSITGWQHLDKLIAIDQEPIGRTPRSNAATYTGAFDYIRKLFADAPAAAQAGLKANHFSFNVVGGRCERCQGAGELTVKMHFLPDSLVRCPVCHGQRFQPQVLAVKYRGHSIADVLNLTIEEAYTLFQDTPAIAGRLGVLVEVGLGYLRLGQPATTLSGGEVQRIKLAKELAQRATGRTLYLLDEPTTGLHVADVARLLTVLQRLVQAGNTVVVIEHNLEVVKAADWVIDLGPEGGAAGGQVIAQGAPETVAQAPGSITGRCLQPLLAAAL